MSERKELLERLGIYSKTLTISKSTQPSLEKGKVVSFKVCPRKVWVLRSALISLGHPVSCRAKSLMERDTLFPPLREHSTDVIIVSVGDLGFRDGAEYRQIRMAATDELHLWLCPAQIALALRIIYGDQPKNERVHIAMDTIPFLYKNKIAYGIFVVGRAGKRFYLDADEIRSDDFFAAEHLFAFVRPPQHKLLQS